MGFPIPLLFSGLQPSSKYRPRSRLSAGNAERDGGGGEGRERIRRRALTSRDITLMRISLYYRAVARRESRRKTFSVWTTDRRIRRMGIFPSCAKTARDAARCIATPVTDEILRFVPSPIIRESSFNLAEAANAACRYNDSRRQHFFSRCRAQMYSAPFRSSFFSFSEFLFLVETGELTRRRRTPRTDFRILSRFSMKRLVIFRICERR